MRHHGLDSAVGAGSRVGAHLDRAGDCAVAIAVTRAVVPIADPCALRHRRRLPRFRRPERHRAARHLGAHQHRLDHRPHRGHVDHGADRAAPEHELGERIRRSRLQHVVLVGGRPTVDRTHRARAPGQGSGSRRASRRDAQLPSLHHHGVEGDDGRLEHAPRRPAGVPHRAPGARASDHQGASEGMESRARRAL